MSARGPLLEKLKANPALAEDFPEAARRLLDEDGSPDEVREEPPGPPVAEAGPTLPTEPPSAPAPSAPEGPPYGHGFLVAGAITIAGLSVLLLARMRGRRK